MLFMLLKIFVNDHNKLPPKLYFFADNCWKENKNRYVFSFLDILVRQKIFREVYQDFLIVGHTGNQCDQLFSILANEFKCEIPTVNDLKLKIRNSPIEPKPIVQSLDVIYDWKAVVEGSLFPLEYHSLYNSFRIMEERGEVTLKVKRLPQVNG